MRMDVFAWAAIALLLCMVAISLGCVIGSQNNKRSLTSRELKILLPALELSPVGKVYAECLIVIGERKSMDESLSKRDEINAKVLVAVDAATHPWGLKVNRIELKDIQPPRDLIDSMARQMKAEREKRANILEAEGHRAAAILRAEGEKQAAILEAEGHREASFRQAEARERLAEAEAKATQMVSDAIASGNVNAINYFVAQKYIEAFKSLAEAPNQKFVLMPMESSGVIGSIAGIADLWKEAIDRPGPRAVVAPPQPRSGA